MFSGLKKLAGSSSLRSSHGSHSRVSTSGSELSSEDSASVATPSENWIPFPGSYSNGSFDRPSSSGSSALGFGYPSSLSSRKNGGSPNRAISFAEKIWHRTRTKSNSGSGTFLHSICERYQSSSHYWTDRENSLSPGKNGQQPIFAAHSKNARASTQPPNLPPILTANDNDPTGHRATSWESLSSATSTNTNSTISPSGRLFDAELFDAFPSVPQDVPQGPLTNTSPRTSYDLGRSTTLPVRSRNYSAQKLA